VPRGSLLKTAFRSERAEKGLGAGCVNVPRYLSDAGRRHRLFGETEAQAKAPIAEAAQTYGRLKPYNIERLDAVNAYIEAHKQRIASISFFPILDLCNLYIDSRHDRNRDHLKGLQNSRNRFPPACTHAWSPGYDVKNLEKLSTPSKTVP
jgi:hypothetical protein